MLESVGSNREVDPGELKQLLDHDPDLILLDCREPEEVAVASLRRAIHIPMREIPGRVQELDRTEEMVVYCHHGVRSLNVVQWLERNTKIRCVKSLRGGIDAWSTQIDL